MKPSHPVYFLSALHNTHKNKSQKAFISVSHLTVFKQKITNTESYRLEHAAKSIAYKISHDCPYIHIDKNHHQYANANKK
jgi:hypothetical protein